MPKTLLRHAISERANEVAAQVLKRGLVKKVETSNGSRYEITEAGWQFLREYEKIMGNVEEPQSNALSDRFPIREQSTSPPNDADRIHLQYESIMPDVGVAVPTRNEASNISNVLREIPKYLHYPTEVMVIDASEDETPSIAAKHGVTVVKQYGQGKGDALRQAFRAMDSDIVVIMDADGSMQPREIPRFVEALFSGADIVKGSRFLRGGGSEDLSFVRKIGNLLFVTFVNLLWSGKYTDLCYGYIAFKRNALEKLTPQLRSDDFQIETEICIKARKLGLRIVEVPSVELRRANGLSKLSGIHDSLKILWEIARECLF
jgi:hypothetical protein